MSISWSSTDGHMRVGIEVSFSSVTSSDTTVDVTVDYWIENVSWSYNDNQTLKWNDDSDSGNHYYGYNNNNGSGQYKIRTTEYTTAVSYSGGPTHSAVAEVQGAYDGSNPSKTKNFSIPARPASAPSAPTATVSNVTSSSARVVLSGSSSNGDSIDSYQTQIATNSGFSTGLQTSSGSTKDWTGLSAATTYYVRGRAHNDIGYSSYSSTKNFTTGATVPGPPTGVGNNTVTQSSANITWTAPGSTGGSAITGYQIQTATNSGFTLNVVTVDDPNDVSPYALTGLDPATTYWARVRTLNGVGASSFSSATSFTTLTGTPSVVAPTAGQSTTRSYPYVTISATGIQATSTITAEFSKDSAFSTIQVNTNLSTDLLTRNDAAAHGLVEGDMVMFSSVTTAAPLVINTPYYVIASGLTTTSFKLATTPSGTAIDLTQTGSVQMHRIITLTSTPGTASGDNQYTLQDTAKLINNGTWYVRTRVYTSAISYTTPNSATVSYTASHTPAALLTSPATGSTAKYTASTNFTFTFSDPSTADKMSAYQLIIEDNAAGTNIYDSTKTVLAGSSNSQSFTRSVNLSSGVKGQVLRWKVRVWDQNNQVSTYTGYSTLTLVDPPLVTITAPTNSSTVTTGTPVFTWTFSAPSGGTQASAYVEVKDSTTNTVVWSKTITGAAVTTTPPVVILQNGKSYVVNVTSTDTYGLATTASNSFSATYSSPSSIAYNFNGDDADTFSYGYVDIDWTNATPDSLFATWKVYRRAESDTTDTWILVFETTDQNVRHYLDYLLIAGDAYSYSVTQTAYRSGSILESTVGYYLDQDDNLTEEGRYVAPDISHYWIIDTVNNQNSIRLENVTADDSNLEFEAESFNIIGRGRHRDYGDELGYSGSLACQVRGTERTSLFRKKIEILRRNQKTYYLRTPFGKLFPIAIGDLGWSPIPGTGISEMGEMTIPYEEVF